MEEKIFSVILNETKQAYETSSLSNSGWFYSIASTRIFDNCTLLIGLNWGVGKEPHEPQKSLPIKSFDELYSIKGELGSFSRLHGRLKTYLKPNQMKKTCCASAFYFCFIVILNLTNAYASGIQPLWSKDLKTTINWQKVTPLGQLMICTGKGIIGVL